MGDKDPGHVLWLVPAIQHTVGLHVPMRVSGWTKGSRETMSVKVPTATRGGSNWKSLPSGGPTVNESLLLTLGMADQWAGITAVQGTPVFP